MEDRLWSRVPPNVASPHFFYLTGFISGIIFSGILIMILK